MNDLEWNRLKSWLQQYTAEADTAASPGELTRLDLSGYGIQALPETFGLLTKLVALNLGGNKLSALPESMEHLAHLSNLDLRRNRFETLPKLLSTMPLRSLNAGGNRLSNIDILAECRELRVLDLNGNALGDIGACLPAENELRTLNLSSNFLKEIGALLPVLGNVERLNLSGNLLSRIPETVDALVSLIEIDLSDNHIEKIDERFFSLEVETVDLSSNRLASLHLHGLSELEALTLDNNPFASLTIAEDFAPGLREFSCDSCGLTQFLLPSSNSLETLCYSSNALTCIPEEISRCTQLRELDIDGNTITDLPDGLANLPALKTLYALGNPLSEAAKKVIAILAPEICDLTMKTGIVIERAKEEDLKEMAALLSVLFAIETDFEIDFDKQLAGIKRLYGHEGSDLLVARHDNAVVGMVTMQRLISSAEGGFIGQIEDLVVKEDYRKMGVGSRLINKIRAIAQEYGYKRIQLAADVNNANALQFYNRRGFRRTHLSIYHYTVS